MQQQVIHVAIGNQYKVRVTVRLCRLHEDMVAVLRERPRGLVAEGVRNVPLAGSYSNRQREANHAIDLNGIDRVIGDRLDATVVG